MDEFQERQIKVASDRGEKAAVAEANTQVQLSQGQTPTIDSNIYEPHELIENGYPLSNPTKEPNQHTKEGARIFGGRDAANGQTMGPVTEMPAVASPMTNRYSMNMDPIYSGLESAQDAFTVETGIAKSFEQVIKYTNSMAEEDPLVAGEEANRVKWATSDNLEQIGFNHVSLSERTDEGLDDKGLNGLQMMMSAQIMRGAADFGQVSAAIGDTGANPEQLEETWNKAVDAYNRAGEGVIQNLPASGEEALSDPRYLGASAILSKAIGKTGIDIKDMSEEQLRDEGMLLIDMIKGNPLILMDAVMKAKDDPQIADAINFLMAAEEGMPTTWGDFGRGVGAAALDPTSYVGIGLAAKVVRGTVVKQALKSAGLVGVEGAVLGGSYMGLMDYGFQNVDVLSGKQEEFDISRSAGQVGLGAGLGFILGSSISGLTSAGKSLLGRMAKPTSAAEEFADVPIPDNMIPEDEMALRRQLREFLKEDNLRKVAESEEDQMKIVEFANDLAELEEKRKLTVIEGGGKGNREPGAQLELVPQDPDINAANKIIDNLDDLTLQVEKAAGIDRADLAKRAENLRKSSAELDKPLPPREILDTDDKWTRELKISLNHQDAGDFKFKIDETITVKGSNEEFKVHHLKWDEKNNRPTYFVVEPDGKRKYIAESELIGGNPDLKVISNEMADLTDVAQKHDPDITRNLQRMTEGEQLILPKPDDATYTSAMRKYATELDEPKEIVGMYQRSLQGPPYFDYATSVNKKEGMTAPERDFFAEIFSSKEDLLDLLEVAPSANFENGQFTIKGEDMFGLTEYLDDVVRLHEGPASEIPVTIRKDTFVSNRLKEFKD